MAALVLFSHLAYLERSIVVGRQLGEDRAGGCDGGGGGGGVWRHQREKNVDPSELPDLDTEGEGRRATRGEGA
jgi:hypothetical protein